MQSTTEYCVIEDECQPIGIVGRGRHQGTGEDSP